MSSIHGQEDASHQPGTVSYEKGIRNLQHFKENAENDTLNLTIPGSPIKKKFDNDDQTLILEKSSFMQESPKV